LTVLLRAELFCRVYHWDYYFNYRDWIHSSNFSRFLNPFQCSSLTWVSKAFAVHHQACGLFCHDRWLFYPAGSRHSLSRSTFPRAWSTFRCSSRIRRTCDYIMITLNAYEGWESSGPSLSYSSVRSFMNSWPRDHRRSCTCFSLSSLGFGGTASAWSCLMQRSLLYSMQTRYPASSCLHGYLLILTAETM
jgi:hypothetical protein